MMPSTCVCCTQPQDPIPPLAHLPSACSVCAPAACSSLKAPSGCGNTPPSNGTYVFDYAGLKRTYHLAMPANYDGSRPSKAILLFHGRGDNGSMWMHDAILQAASNNNFILIAPDGVTDPVSTWHVRGGGNGTDPQGNPVCDPVRQPRTECSWKTCDNCATQNPCAWTNCGDDVGFVMALLDHLEASLCISDVFAAGASNGGMFTWDLASNATSAWRLRAIAPMIGLPHRGYLQAPGVALPVLLMTGRNDVEIPPGGQQDMYTQSSDGRNHMYYTSAAAMSRVWAVANGCNATTSTSVDMAPLGGGDDVLCTTYCTDGAVAQVDCRGPGGHQVDPKWMLQLMFTFFNMHATGRP